MAHRANPVLPIILARIFLLQDGITKDQRGVREVDSVFREVAFPLGGIPFKLHALNTHLCPQLQVQSRPRAMP